MKHLIAASIVGFGVALLVGCGGGGGGGGGGSDGAVVASSSAFSIDAAYKSNLSTARNISWTLSGTVQNSAVTGAGTWMESGLSATTFNGGAAQVRLVKTNGTIMTQGQSAPLTITQNTFYDSAFRNVGSTGSAGSSYQTSTLSVLPTNAKIGDSGPLEIVTSFSDSGKLNKISTGTLTWVLSADSATTALLKITTVVITPTGVGNSTVVDTVRVFATGETTKVKFESQGADQLTFSF